MAKITRYKFIKNIYKDTLIIFVTNKNKIGYRSFSTDDKILKLINFKKIDNLNERHINYIIIDNLTIIEYKKFDDNNYKNYYLKVGLIDIINLLKHRAIF